MFNLPLLRLPPNKYIFVPTAAVPMPYAAVGNLVDNVDNSCCVVIVISSGSFPLIHNLLVSLGAVLPYAILRLAPLEI